MKAVHLVVQMVDSWVGLKVAQMAVKWAEHLAENSVVHWVVL